MKTLLDVEKDELSAVIALSVEMPKTFSRKSSTSSISSSSLSRALLFSESKVQNINLNQLFFRVLKDLLVLNFSGNFGAFLIAYLKFFKNFFLAPHSSVLSFIIGKVRFVFYSDFFTLLSICSVEHKPISLYTIKSYVLWP